VGWRRKELSALAWNDLSLETRELRLKRFDSKNREPRKIVLSGELSEIIQRRWETRQYEGENGEWNLSPLVFYRVKGSGVRKPGAPAGDFRKIWQKACEDAGVPGKYFHDFRRTAVLNMRRAGVSEEVAMKISGHQTSSAFKRYHITDDRDIADALARTQQYVDSLPKERNEMLGGDQADTKATKTVTKLYEKRAQRSQISGPGICEFTGIVGVFELRDRPGGLHNSKVGGSSPPVPTKNLRVIVP
jgi:hypothetical protein